MTEWDLAYMRRKVKPQPEPVAWGMFRADGLILDVITPEEHESHAGEYTVPLYAAAPAAPAVPLTDERAAFEAWIRKDCGDLTTFGSGSNMHYRNSAVNNAWTGWQARAHGIAGGGE